MSLPWMPLYVADYLSKTSHLNAAESGAYMHLIMHYWQNGCLPQDDCRLARIARMTAEEWAAAKPIIYEFFDDGWRHERIDEELAEAELKHSRRVAAGKLAHKAEAMPEQCSSNAPVKPHTTTTHNHKEKKVSIADWHPHEKHIALAISLKVDILDVEETFRDYVANHPRKYRDFDAAFRQFLKNAPKFNGVQHGKATGNLVSAGNALVEKIRAFGGTPGIRGEEGNTVIRLLPQERSERPRNIRDGSDGDTG